MLYLLKVWTDLAAQHQPVVTPTSLNWFMVLFRLAQNLVQVEEKILVWFNTEKVHSDSQTKPVYSHWTRTTDSGCGPGFRMRTLSVDTDLVSGYEPGLRIRTWSLV